MDMFSVFPDFLLSLASRFSMARELHDDGIELFFKRTFLIAPGILSSSCSMDEEDDLPPLQRLALSCPVTDLPCPG
jgi:hypothetical protein